MKRFIIKYWKILIIVALIVTAVSVISNRQTTKKIQGSITTVRVMPSTFTKTLTSSGKTKANASVDLKFQTSGKLSWVGVKEGDTVKKYQIIASLDSREVQKSLEKTLRDYSAERNDFEESRQVTYGFRQTTDVNDTAKRILEKNQWDLEKAVMDVELKSLALELSTLVTPIAGIVTHVDTPVAGVNITPATAVFSVADPASLIFEATVDETDIASLTSGGKATIRLDAFSESTFSGTIRYVSYVAQQSSGGATVFPVKISFDNPENLRIGLNGDIEIETDRQENVFTVPTEAVREEKGTTYVYKKIDGRYEKTPVTTGVKNEDDIIVTSGLQSGDVIVTKGFSSIPK